MTQFWTCNKLFVYGSQLFGSWTQRHNISKETNKKKPRISTRSKPVTQVQVILQSNSFCQGFKRKVTPVKFGHFFLGVALITSIKTTISVRGPLPGELSFGRILWGQGLASMLGDLKFKHQGGHSHLEAIKKTSTSMRQGRKRMGTLCKKHVYIH